MKMIAVILIAVFFGLLVLALALIVLTSLAVTLAALVYRLIPGPNVPLGYNLRNMVVRWRNSAVTAAAFVVVIGLLVFMLAFVNGMYRLTESSGRPGNVIMLKSGAADENFSDLPADADVRRLPKDVQEEILKNEQGDHLASKEVYIVVNQPIPNAPTGGKQRRFVQLRGLHDASIAATVHGIDLQEGRWFSQQGVQAIKGTSVAPDKEINPTALIAIAGCGASLIDDPNDRAIEIVIGQGIARELGFDRPGGPLKCGETIELGGRKWIVVGVMSTGNSTFASEVWCRDYLAQELFGRRNSYSSFVAATRDAKAAERTAKALKDFQELPLNAMPETEYYSKLNATNQQFLVAILIVAVIMAIGGVLGVMNLMFAAISQRAKDIGVLRLVGYSRWQVLVSFLLESMVIAFAGGVLGCALGYLSDGLTATSIVTNGQGGGGKSVILSMVVDAKTIAVGLVFTFIMGAVGGCVPAISAMRLKPLESLR